MSVIARFLIPWKRHPSAWLELAILPGEVGAHVPFATAVEGAAFLAILINRDALTAGRL
jgi:hypothetical protein